MISPSKGESALEALEAVLGQALAGEVVRLLPGHALDYLVTDQGGRPLTRAELACMPQTSLKNALVHMFDPKTAVTYQFGTHFNAMTAWDAIADRATREQRLASELEGYFNDVYTHYRTQADKDLFLQHQVNHLMATLSDGDLETLAHALRGALGAQRARPGESTFVKSLAFLQFGQKHTHFADFEIRTPSMVWELKAPTADFHEDTIKREIDSMRKKIDHNHYTGRAELAFDLIPRMEAGKRGFGDKYLAGRMNAILEDIKDLDQNTYHGTIQFDFRVIWLEKGRITSTLFRKTSSGWEIIL